MINTVCFFELPADEFEPLQDFYNKLFNWTFEKVPGGSRYYRIHMGQDTPKGGMTVCEGSDPHARELRES